MFTEEPSYDPIPMSEAEYLAFELASPFRYEYRNGQAFYKMGSSSNHNLISAGLLVSMMNLLDDSDCLVYHVALRLKVRTMPYYAYPDLMVVCGETELAEGIFDTVLNPILIAEVLAPRTETLDRSEKFEAYKKIPTFQEYLLIAQDKFYIEHFVRTEAGNWIQSSYEGVDAVITLKSVSCDLRLADVYRQIDDFS